MTFFGSVAATARIASAASAPPTAFVLSRLFSSSQSSHQNTKPQNSFLSVSSSPLYSLACFGLVKNLAQPSSAIIMGASTSDHKPTSHVTSLTSTHLVVNKKIGFLWIKLES
uniref:Uncharacterized protein n=1 Tax=Rhizophora mucronata TaxID=61149 RepID=A0A2P2KAU2_RHIMU